MKGFTKVDSKDHGMGSMAKPPFSTDMKEMPRETTGGRRGDTFKLTSNARYGTAGVDGPDKPTEMPRATKAAPGGSGKSSLPPVKKFGLGEGVDNPVGNRYGVGGI